MKKTIALSAAAAVALLAIFACSHKLEPEVAVQDGTFQNRTYTLTVIAEKGDAATKALALEGSTLKAIWNQGEKVSVCSDGGDLLGELEAQSSGTSTTLRGTLVGDISAGDKLILKFLSPDYTSQEGTIEYIATHCDYSTAEVTVSAVAGNNVTVGDAQFTSRQAIVKFTLKEKSSGEIISGGVSSLTVKAGSQTITVIPASASSELYVAIPAVSGSDIEMEATVASDGSKRYYHKESATFAQGKYYTVGVSMSQTGIHYIERSWNGTEVIAEDKIVTDYTVLNGTDSDAEYTLQAGRWYVVQSSFERKSLTVQSGSAVNLVICDGATLTSQITINSSSSLNIYPQTSGTGKIKARGYGYGDSYYKAAIGSDGKGKMGVLNIHGGVITAEADGENPCSGIGGGGSLGDGSANHGGTVAIYSGTITAKGAMNGSAIGGGYSTSSPSGDGGSLKVYGGTVVADGGSEAAGIGGAHNASGGTIEIYGGKVEAQGGSYGAGIGGGNGGTGGNITVNGGSVEARGGDFSAGIGGGKGVSGGTVTVNGGTVKAWGGEDGAGIGSGEQHGDPCNGGTVIINGGYVEAHGYPYGKQASDGFGAGIGGGQDGSGATVTVTGGTVMAYGGMDSAGIGSGEETTGGPNINGGSLTVTGGSVFADGTGYGAGIGAGQDAEGATVVITGGTVEAWSGEDASSTNGSAIGSHQGDGHRGTLKIEGDLRVYGWAKSDSAKESLTYGERVPGCFYRTRARVEPCTDHTFVDGKCKWCGHAQ